MNRTSRRLDPEERFYEEFAPRFDARMNQYDTERRLWVVFDALLAEEDLQGRALLDAGCGTGWFSRAAANRGARVFSMDVGPKLLRETARKCVSRRVIGDLLQTGFCDDSFDCVVASDVIEHTADPRRALSEILRVLKPGGCAVVTVPNRLWKPALWIARALRVRPYEGHEHWVGPCALLRWLKEEGGVVEEQRGLHLFPFVFSFTHPLLRLLDRAGALLYALSVNLCVRVRKGPAS
ncbi:MAG: class I SAM-dependent methyltransferase [Planctomycetota bacterium]